MQFNRVTTVGRYWFMIELHKETKKKNCDNGILHCRLENRKKENCYWFEPSQNPAESATHFINILFIKMVIGMLS